ncbi:hypothetical protein [Fodinicurvata sp. EGI_FJ10296]|uniref:hypothetical protein n=1 Tax=Fodinicurvata sp. EGI_FJ10296 TaxID=3231908 RepID=UPI003453789A
MHDIFNPIVKECLRSNKGDYTLYVFGDATHLRWAVLGKIAQHFRIEVEEIRDGDHLASLPKSGRRAFIKWSPRSRYIVPDEWKALLPPGTHIINDTGFDCDKTNVEKCFETVAGYPLAVDPLTYDGIAASKSIRNAAHDGKTVQCPVTSVEPDQVYERLIDNVYSTRAGDDYVCDMRTPVIFGDVPFVYLKYRPIKSRFQNKNAYARAVSKYEVFSYEEVEIIKAFSCEIELDYGEIDVLRDRHDGRIFIIDANNTPYGPPNHIDSGDRSWAVRLLGQMVIEHFFAARDN